ncbi:MAG: UxaA family hydrolase [Deltaproteobacteria bacterium]|nr:UxaA family hydrolase [Deltaproteobacteria bacterium]
MKFKGYQRPDGRVGIRNHVLILPTVACANETCRVMADKLPGAVSFVNQNGCGEVEISRRITQRVLAGFAANPNIYGTLMVGLGCELNQMDEMSALVREKTNKPLETLLIQEEGGTINTIRKGTKIIRDMLIEASACERESFDLSRLMVALECGGSDSTSGLVANPAVGKTTDILIASGATAILSETAEIVGAEHLLAVRAADPQTKEKIFDIVAKLETSLEAVGENLRSAQPSPGNKKGGLSTIEEKSLGCIHKGGSSPLMEVLDYACPPTRKGLVFMDTAGYDVLSVTAKVAGGCQLVIFTTGRGNPVGNPIAPVVKVTANRDTYIKMEDNIDMDLSSGLDGSATIDQLGQEILEEILRIANGKKTKAETLGFGFTETVMKRVCDYV